MAYDIPVVNVPIEALRVFPQASRIPDTTTAYVVRADNCGSATIDVALCDPVERTGPAVMEPLPDVRLTVSAEDANCRTMLPVLVDTLVAPLVGCINVGEAMITEEHGPVPEPCPAQDTNQIKAGSMKKRATD